MSVQRRYTSADLDLLPDIPGVRYEIIDGELHVSKRPSWNHQRAGSRIWRALENWNDETGLGEASEAPGLIFADDDDVAPDVVWISKARLAGALDTAGHLTTAPELVVEVLSPGTANVRRDRISKFDLYARHGVQEYWIVDCGRRIVDVFRLEGTRLRPIGSLANDDILTSTLLPDFALPLRNIW